MSQGDPVFSSGSVLCPNGIINVQNDVASAPHPSSEIDYNVTGHPINNPLNNHVPVDVLGTFQLGKDEDFDNNHVINATSVSFMRNNSPISAADGEPEPGFQLKQEPTVFF